MRTVRSLFALLALALGAAACESSNRIVMPGEVVGVWSDSVVIGTGIDALTLATYLHLRADGDFIWDQITYGGGTHGPDVPTQRTTLYGDYRLRPGVLDIRTLKVEHHEMDPRPTVEYVANPRWSGDFYRARFQGDDLELTYTTAPADAPIETRMTFHRLPPGRPID
jgi:hypothetical protein